jgi:hypothetical protein
MIWQQKMTEKLKKFYNYFLQPSDRFPQAAVTIPVSVLPIFFFLGRLREYPGFISG